MHSFSSAFEQQTAIFEVTFQLRRVLSKAWSKCQVFRKRNQLYKRLTAALTVSTDGHVKITTYMYITLYLKFVGDLRSSIVLSVTNIIKCNSQELVAVAAL